MGYGFKKRKKTAKELEADSTKLEERMAQGFFSAQMAIRAVNSKFGPLEQITQMLDFRSLATLRILVEKGVITNEEHEALAEKLRVEAFDVQSAQDDAARGLVAVDEPIGPDRIYVVHVEAKKAEDGEAIPQLSLLRSKATFGGKDFPASFEKNFEGLKAGETKTFTIECPEDLGPFAGQQVTFTVDVLKVLKSTRLPKLSDGDEGTRSYSEDVEEDDSVAESPEI